MGLREIAAADARRILEDVEYGFGWAAELTAPDGTVASITGYSTDINLLIDPDTGQQVSGRSAEMSVSLLSLSAIGVPRGVTRRAETPWLLRMTDTLGNEQVFKVAESHPDNNSAVIVLRLEAWTDGA